MKKGIGPRGLGAPKSAAKMYKSPAKKMTDPPTKKDIRVSDMYAGAAGAKEGRSKLEEHRKKNPRAARKMPADQQDRIINSYRNAEISRRRAERPDRYYDTSKLNKNK